MLDAKHLSNSSVNLGHDVGGVNSELDYGKYRYLNNTGYSGLPNVRRQAQFSAARSAGSLSWPGFQEPTYTLT